MQRTDGNSEAGSNDAAPVPTRVMAECGAISSWPIIQVAITRKICMKDAGILGLQDKEVIVEVDHSQYMHQSFVRA